MKLVLVLPAYNEAAVLEHTVATTVAFCRAQVRTHTWQLVIADNASTDATAQIGRALAAQYPEVVYTHVPAKGKGAAVLTAWRSIDADWYGFMDADLATHLDALPRAVAELERGADAVFGSRAHPKSQVYRSLLRRATSWGYRQLLRGVLGTRLHDLPCGFKWITRQVRDAVVPAVQSHDWFFDSELGILAEAAGYRIVEIPVTWHDSREGHDTSRVNIWAVGREYLSAALALRRRLKT